MRDWKKRDLIELKPRDSEKIKNKKIQKQKSNKKKGVNKN